MQALFPTGVAFLRGWPPALVFCALFAAAAQIRAQPYAIHWRTETPVAVEVEGLSLERLGALGPADRPRVFAVFAQQENENSATGAAAMPPMAGAWSVDGNRLRFVPRFPFTRGVRYRAEFRPAGEAPVIAFFELPADKVAPSTIVRQVFPSGDRLPENQLKFYVQFSAPMSRGGTYEHIRLREANGAAIELPFLELDEELWDPTMTRLTLLIDPGRIKRGVKPLEDVGAVFETGKTYSLTIDAACRDAAGRPLRESFVKKIEIVPADRTPPDAARWKVSPPADGTRDALVVDFDEPMDQALALRLIGVVKENAGKSFLLEGEAALGRNEQRWSFVPAQPWSAGAHRLTIQTTIEDLAGNNPGKAFDVNLAEAGERRPVSETVGIAFVIR